MTAANYKTLLKAEAQKLKALLVERKALKARIDEMNKNIISLREGVIGLGALAGVDIRTTHPELFKADIQAHIGLTDAIRKAFDEMDQGEGYSVSEIREEIEDLGFPIHQHKNPIASISAVLKRLVDAGQVVPATDQDRKKTIYFWADGYGATKLANQDEAFEEE